jgi:PEP-CTERM motif-containing protein
MRVLSVLTLLLGLLASPSDATLIYEYNGKNFDAFTGSVYDSTDHVTLVFSTESSLAGYATLTDITGLVTAFSISDGVNTLTDADAYGLFRVQTSSSGDIINWLFSTVEPKVASLGDPSILITTRNLVSDVFDAGVMGPCGQVSGNLCVGVIIQERGLRQNDPGVWTRSVPEPSALLLLASGLVGLAAWARRMTA